MMATTIQNEAESVVALDHDVMADLEEDLLTLHEDVMEENDEGVDEILRDYTGDLKTKLR